MQRLRNRVSYENTLVGPTIAAVSKTIPKYAGSQTGKQSPRTMSLSRRFVNQVEHFVNTKVDAAKRQEVWEKAFTGLKCEKRTVVSEPLPPHEHPSTPYSMSRAPEPQTNKQLVDDLCKAVEKDERFAKILGTTIAANDSSPKGSFNAIIRAGGEDGPTVVGGRLGRDHTLEDVPHHFVRDQCMNYILEELPVELQERVARIVFTDLNDADLQSYKEALHVARHAEEVADELKAKLPSLKNRGEAKNLLKLEAAIDAIDYDIDLTPNLNGFRAYRDYEVNEYISWSCIHPNQKPAEQEDNTGAVRAMIARLVKYSDGEWTTDSFRKAIGPLERPKLIDFLQRRGPAAGSKLGLFGLAWEFFRKRELLGVALPGSATETVARDANALKRKRVPLEEKVVNVATKSAEERQVQVKARKIAADPEDGMIHCDVYRKFWLEALEWTRDRQRTVRRCRRIVLTWSRDHTTHIYDTSSVHKAYAWTGVRSSTL
ncbi:hypothetical protein LTR56_011435 [Elasticomyces elasticus]|nr:hypothetical protein LTR56_011435 [Elasticomyces elasticus]KAK3655971.1 hypothetical protein LTR22_009980 [Elasticomyces elasticus]KAK4921471.1 hypothetical protein LTR49_011125 [Elasticomyces elasticus]KAK5760058.1 hypothetical protein LTS12_009789 [Elasticomyces elasticus]